ncbi:MAG: sigma-70 family RNA polymerase sigma factor [Actinomycetota bacterium]|nr:sigma-70 family RNA polymerase sigma factor [Actinomycetota bacterium]
MTSRMQSPADAAVEEALVTEHLPLVGYLVSEILGRLPAHVSRDELMSAGLAALAYVARGYDADRGVPFGRFASARIRGALIDELRSSDWASRSVRSRARRRDAAEEELTRTLRRTPTPVEVADLLGVAAQELGAVDEDVQRAVVLSLQGFGETSSLDEHVSVREPAPEEVVLHRERIGYLRDAVEVLPERLRTVVVRYFFEERPMAEIAEELGVSESRVSQMRGEALALLKDGLNAQLEPSLVPQPTRPDGCASRRREAYFTAVAARSDYRARITAGDLESRPAVPAPRRPEPAVAAGEIGVA